MCEREGDATLRDLTLGGLERYCRSQGYPMRLHCGTYPISGDSSKTTATGQLALLRDVVAQAAEEKSSASRVNHIGDHPVILWVDDGVLVVSDKAMDDFVGEWHASSTSPPILLCRGESDLGIPPIAILRCCPETAALLDVLLAKGLGLADGARLFPDRVAASDSPSTMPLLVEAARMLAEEGKDLEPFAVWVPRQHTLLQKLNHLELAMEQSERFASEQSSRFGSPPSAAKGSTSEQNRTHLTRSTAALMTPLAAPAIPPANTPSSMLLTPLGLSMISLPPAALSISISTLGMGESAADGTGPAADDHPLLAKQQGLADSQGTAYTISLQKPQAETGWSAFTSGFMRPVNSSRSLLSSRSLSSSRTPPYTRMIPHPHIAQHALMSSMDLGEESDQTGIPQGTPMEMGGDSEVVNMERGRALLGGDRQPGNNPFPHQGWMFAAALVCGASGLMMCARFFGYM